MPRATRSGDHRPARGVAPGQDKRRYAIRHREGCWPNGRRERLRRAAFKALQTEARSLSAGQGNGGDFGFAGPCHPDKQNGRQRLHRPTRRALGLGPMIDSNRAFWAVPAAPFAAGVSLAADTARKAKKERKRGSGTSTRCSLACSDWVRANGCPVFYAFRTNPRWRNSARVYCGATITWALARREPVFLQHRRQDARRSGTPSGAYGISVE